MTKDQEDKLKELIDHYWNVVWLAGKHRIAAAHKYHVETMLKDIKDIVEWFTIRTTCLLPYKGLDFSLDDT